MGPNGGSEVVFGVTVHGVVDFAVRYQYYISENLALDQLIIP